MIFNSACEAQDVYSHVEDGGNSYVGRLLQGDSGSGGCVGNGGYLDDELRL